MSKQVLIPKFTDTQITNKIKTDSVSFINKITECLQFIGVETSDKARDGASYRDVTGNLRHSTGSDVFIDGKSSISNFKGGDDGEKTGKALITQLGQKTKGVALIICAGMNYAEQVEARGRTVLTAFMPSKEEIERDLKEWLT